MDKFLRLRVSVRNNIWTLPFIFLLLKKKWECWMEYRVEFSARNQHLSHCRNCRNKSFVTILDNSSQLTHKPSFRWILLLDHLDAGDSELIESSRRCGKDHHALWRLLLSCYLVSLSKNAEISSIIYQHLNTWDLFPYTFIDYCQTMTLLLSVFIRGIIFFMLQLLIYH